MAPTGFTQLRFISVALLAWLLGSPLAARDRAHELAAEAAGIEPASCRNVKSSKDCHDRYPAGCSKATKPRYDAYLSYLKNQAPDPDLQAEKTLMRTDFEQLDRELPQGLSRDNHADHARALADLGEGNIHAVEGFIYFADNIGKAPCNCELGSERSADLRIGLGFDPDVAARVRDGALRYTRRKDRKLLQQTSIVIVMSPHYRARFHPDWTPSEVLGWKGRKVLVRGQLLADNEHANPSDSCAHPAADQTKCWRASTWELHPVMKVTLLD